MLKRGALIVFEGADKSGKTTQCSELYFALREIGIPVKRIAFPVRDPSSSLSHAIVTCLNGESNLNSHAKALLFAAERFTKQKEIADELESGTTIIVDRYVHSGIAYACASGVGRRFASTINNGLFKPALTILLDASEDLFSERKLDLHEQPENVGFQRSVISEYKSLTDSDWLVIDAEKPVSHIREVVFSRALQTLRAVGDLLTFQM